jgi:triacylglycerol esterase/lipase EstA (alpha/beta hydrolase family)
MGRPRHHIVLVPGLFGFARLGGFDYFTHVEEALASRFLERGADCEFVSVSSPPTGSIVHRTQVLMDAIQQACSEDAGAIHLVGHSTGGLDVRLLASPTAWPDAPDWFDRVRTVTSIATPHYGTPLAYFFTTMAGTRLLEALSLLTYMTLQAGGPPLTALTPLIAAVGRLDQALGIENKFLEKTIELLLSFLGEEGQSEVREWFDGIRSDQGAIIQLTPESMDIFNAGVENNPNLRYGCVATRMPPPGPVRLLKNLRSPVNALSAAVFSTLYVGAGRTSKIYPPPGPTPEVRKYLELKLGRELDNSLNDGLVPTTSMIWGDVLWAGTADHLDVLGHFHGDRDSKHTDWLVSGAGFREDDFDEVMDAVAEFQLQRQRRGSVV